MVNRIILLLSILSIVSLACADQIDSTQPDKSREQLNKIYELVDQRVLDLPFFTEVLSGDSHTQEAALLGLGRIGGKAITQLVVPFLNHNNPSLRKAAAFALGISENQQFSKILWERLAIEKDKSVKQEIYLALGGLGGDGLANKLLERVNLEKNTSILATIFQALAAAITYHPDVSEQIGSHKNTTILNTKELLERMTANNQLTYAIGYFLARVKNIEQLISPAQLQRFMAPEYAVKNKRIIARLIGKVVKANHLANRRLLSWLIEQSESKDIPLRVESINAMAPLLQIAQARLQLGKLHGDPNPLVAQSALQVLANSSLDSMQIMQLLKKNLKSSRPAMVVAAMSGLVKRQSQEDMTWALKILTHPNAFVKIRFAMLIADKDKKGFTNVLRLLAKDKDPKVSTFVADLIAESTPKSIKTNTPAFNVASLANLQKLIFTTTQGDIEIQTNQLAPYTANHIIHLAKAGYYNDTYFSRMLGNFVAQGGDSVGNVDGGSGRMIREELSYLSHLQGTVGIATSGKDTGDAQFFINLNDNIHLDRKYTIFGKVTKGLDVAFKLSNGDKILKAKVID